MIAAEPDNRTLVPCCSLESRGHQMCPGSMRGDWVGRSVTDPVLPEYCSLVCDVTCTRSQLFNDSSIGCFHRTFPSRRKRRHTVSNARNLPRYCGSMVAVQTMEDESKPPLSSATAEPVNGRRDVTASWKSIFRRSSYSLSLLSCNSSSRGPAQYRTDGRHPQRHS